MTDSAIAVAMSVTKHADMISFPTFVRFRPDSTSSAYTTANEVVRVPCRRSTPLSTSNRASHTRPARRPRTDRRTRPTRSPAPRPDARGSRRDRLHAGQEGQHDRSEAGEKHQPIGARVQSERIADHHRERELDERNRQADLNRDHARQHHSHSKHCSQLDGLHDDPRIDSDQHRRHQRRPTRSYPSAKLPTRARLGASASCSIPVLKRPKDAFPTPRASPPFRRRTDRCAR